MLSLRDMDDAQNEAITVLYENDQNLLVAPTGSGKTAVALTAINELGCAGALKKVLVICPLKVADLVWRTEARNWEHLQEIKVGIAIEGERDAVFKRLDRFDIVVINFELIPWMAKNDMFKHFDGICIDEISKLSGGQAWFKAIRRFIKDFTWRTMMSATPITETFTQLFYIQFCVDAGAALGRNRDKHLRTFFYPEDREQRKWALFPGKGEELVALVEPTLHVMPDYKAGLPRLNVAVVPVEMPAGAMRSYKEMVGKSSTAGVTAKTAAEVVGKCQQIASGWLYSENETIEMHLSKLEALDSLLQMAKGDPVIVVFQHDEERRRLEEFYPGMEFLGKGSNDLLLRWNRGKVHLLGMHIRTGAHGLNLQAPCHRMVLLAPVWSQDAMAQVVDRIWRRGQRFPCDVAILATIGTVDELILERLAGKAELMPAFLQHVEDVKAEMNKSAIILPFGVTRH